MIHKLAKDLDNQKANKPVDLICSILALIPQIDHLNRWTKKRMKLIPDDIKAFLHFDDVVKMNERIKEKTAQLISNIESEVDKAKAIFEWVRDKIPHTKDVNREEVTCSSTEAFDHGTGICFAKSHVLASMMRSENIPCGFCYQIFNNPISTIPDSMALHGLNAIFLNSTKRWHRIDPRGNRHGINAKFSIKKESLAFPEMKFIDDCIYSKPLEQVVEGLQTATSISELWPVLPSVKIKNVQQKD